MNCKNCPEGRRFAKGSIDCLLYGMIIREDHECTREGGKRHETDGTAGDGPDIREGTELSENSSGAA